MISELLRYRGSARASGALRVWAVAACIAALSIQCAKKPRANPLDVQGDSYTPPQVSIVSGPTEGGSVTDELVEFSWSGNQAGCEFRYRIDDLPWGPWTDTTDFGTLLDDGSHVFTISVRYPDGDDYASESVSFTVDALAEPAIFISPILQTATSGFPVDIVIKAKGLPRAHQVHIVIIAGGITVENWQVGHAYDIDISETRNPNLPPMPLSADERIVLVSDTIAGVVDIIVGPQGEAFSGDDTLVCLTVDPGYLYDSYNDYTYGYGPNYSDICALVIGLYDVIVRDSAGNDIPIAIERGGFVFTEGNPAWMDIWGMDYDDLEATVLDSWGQ